MIDQLAKQMGGKNIEILKINIKINKQYQLMLMSKAVRKHILAIRKDKQDQSDFILVIADLNKYSDAKVINQLPNKPNAVDIVFQPKELVAFKPVSILVDIEVECKQQYEEFNRINSQLFNVGDSEYSQVQGRNDKFYQPSDDQSDNEEQQDFQASENDKLNRGRGRPKGSKNRKKNQQPQDQDSEQDYSEKKRGRGRPKGSKNKKNMQFKRTDGEGQVVDFKALLTAHLERGKGLMMSKNQSRIQSSEPTIKDQNSYWKRGKGRPKGSKNKAKIAYEREKIQKANLELKQKRSRGRPKGVKNKPRSEQEELESSQFNEQYNLPMIQSDLDKRMDCCSKCKQRFYKQELLKCKNVYELRKIISQNDNSIFNVFTDIGLENKSNIIVKALKSNNIQIIKLLLSIVDRVKPYFRTPWEMEGKLELTNYTVKTRREALSRSGKEGINVLLHDTDRKVGEWWEILKVDRILESLNNNTPLQIVQLLKSHSPRLKQSLYENIPSLIRCGNYTIAKYLLKDLIPGSYNTYGYSRQHLQCLQKTNSEIQFKKINILKQNFSSNFCSPIHCAAINPNSDLLTYLLKNIHDYNVGDNLNRKPIHYASAADSTKNLQILLNFGSDLKDMDKLKITPLMVAASYGRTHNLQFILSKVNDSTYLNFRSEEGYCALHYAIIQNHLQAVKILLKAKSIDVNIQTKQKQTALHLAAGVGNIDIFNQVLDAGAIIDYYDKYKRTPLMFAIRNNNNQIAIELIKLGAKYYKGDSSLNSILHYAAAYGNINIIRQVSTVLKQSKNKRNYYPWEMAVGKGHLGCAKLLQNVAKTQQVTTSHQQKNIILFNLLKVVNGTKESIEIIKYLANSGIFDLSVCDEAGSNVFHYICNISMEQYTRIRKRDLNDPCIPANYFNEQFNAMMKEIITLFLEYKVDPNISNFKEHTPITLCIENGNIIGMRLLLTEKMNLDYQSSKGYTIFHYLSKLASQGTAQMKFVYEKLRLMDKNSLKDNLKKVDSNGFEAILYFVKDFTLRVKQNFKDNVNNNKQDKIKTNDAQLTQQELFQINKIAFQNFQQHQSIFINLISFMTQLGCDANVQVLDKRKDDEGQNYKKWGIQHFLMRFPSLPLLGLFRGKIRDFNAQNFNGMTPLHLFCMWNKKGNLLEAEGQAEWYKQYTGQKSLQFLLQNGLNPNILDINRSTPLLYTALNRQISFIILLRRFGSSINNCNNKNQVPFIEIIKMKNFVNFDEIQSLLKIGADPNYEDLEKRNSLHHLVHHATNLDTSPQLCKILFEYGAKINSLDKYNRTPVFYCFTKIDPQVKQNQGQTTNDKVEILQTIINHKQINLNHEDVYKRTAIHYACQKNYFFSILYLLDKNINIQVQDYEGNTPLAICLKHRNLNQAALLLKRGVKDGYVYIQDQKISYFVYAMTKLSVGICYMLLDYGYPIEKALNEVTNQAFKKLLMKKYKS